MVSWIYLTHSIYYIIITLGAGGPDTNDDIDDTLKVRGGKVETLSKYCFKILEIIDKQMNIFINHGLISLNTAPTLQNIFLMIIEKHILII